MLIYQNARVNATQDPILQLDLSQYLNPVQASQRMKTCIMVRAVVTLYTYRCTVKKIFTGPTSFALCIWVIIEQETGTLTLSNVYCACSSFIPMLLENDLGKQNWFSVCYSHS